mmetsp:Transcript_44587/g.103291  ORF Transcript_44587/g.103291 Transcript_44587/m.103291 type:complete len:83 (-) Transcript_44587:315-563(-)
MSGRRHPPLASSAARSYGVRRAAVALLLRPSNDPTPFGAHQRTPLALVARMGAPKSAGWNKTPKLDGWSNAPRSAGWNNKVP